MMPPKEALTEEQIGWAANVCDDDKIITGDSILNNKQKWNRVKEVFKADKASLFSDIDYRDWFSKDDPRTCEAAAFFADLRAQWLAKMLDGNPTNPYLHRWYLLNKQWQVRLRERARMHVMGELIKRHGKLI